MTMEKLPYGARILLWLLKTIYGIDPAIPLYQVRSLTARKRKFLTYQEKLELRKKNENT